MTIITGHSTKEYTFRPLSNRGGRGAEYPWWGTPVGGFFFKPVSKEDLDLERGRPSFPKSVKNSNMKWKTSKQFCEETKQYGYLCQRER